MTLKHPWTRGAALLFLAGSLSSGCAPAPGPSPGNTLSLGSRRQLFLDDSLTRSKTGLSRVLHQPQKVSDTPLLPRTPKESTSWDAGMFIGFSSVLYDQREGLFKIWYSLHPGEGGDELARLCYATSRDGIRWQ